MEDIPEEQLDLAFDNKAYLSLTFNKTKSPDSNQQQQQDSGFDSATSYENVESQPNYENVSSADQEEELEQEQPCYQNINIPEKDEPTSYENVNPKKGSQSKIVEEDASYENIETPSINYLNLDFIPPPPLLRSLSNINTEEEPQEIEEYEKLMFPNSNIQDDGAEESYQNVAFVPPPPPNTVRNC
jgi:hypothetical protein